MTTARIPGATYRLQFNHSFRFADARALVPYLHALGITDLYASPILKARRGSPHGYDITDHGTLNPEIGSDDDLAELTGSWPATAWASWSMWCRITWASM